MALRCRCRGHSWSWEHRLERVGRAGGDPQPRKHPQPPGFPGIPPFRAVLSPPNTHITPTGSGTIFPTLKREFCGQERLVWTKLCRETAASLPWSSSFPPGSFQDLNQNLSWDAPEFGNTGVSQAAEGAPPALPACPQCPFPAGPGELCQPRGSPSSTGKWSNGEKKKKTNPKKPPLELPGTTALPLSPKDIPVSLPVQCTEDVLTGDGQSSPESRHKHPAAPTSSASRLEGSACPVEPPQATKKLPPSPGSRVGTAGAAAFGSTEGEEGDEPAWTSPWILPVPWEGGRAPHSPRGLQPPNPGAGGSFPELLDLYQVPEALEREDARRDEALVEIRGPVKVIWEPGREFGPCWSYSITHTGGVAEWGYFLTKSLGTHISGPQGNWAHKNP